MPSGHEGTGLYGKQRTLADALRADRNQLKNAPLSDRERKRLTKQIEVTEAELKEVRRQIREGKKEP
jgi:hypothetical protein